MKSKILKIAAASLLVTVSVVTAAGCSFKVDMPDNLKQVLCDHEWKEGDVLRSATCEREGEVELVCKLCGATDTDELPKLEHIVETVAGKAATCTVDGYTDGERCIVGGEWITAPKTVPASHIDERGEGVCDVCKEIFVDTSTYEQVAVSETDFCVGTWYRLEYTPGTDDSPGSSSQLNFSGIDCLFIGYHFEVGPALTHSSFGPLYKLDSIESFAFILTDTYFDFCILESYSITDPADMETTLSILETSTWANPDATGFYKLVP